MPQMIAAERIFLSLGSTGDIVDKDRSKRGYLEGNLEEGGIGSALAVVAAGTGPNVPASLLVGGSVLGAWEAHCSIAEADRSRCMRIAVVVVRRVGFGWLHTGVSDRRNASGHGSAFGAGGRDDDLNVRLAVALVGPLRLQHPAPASPFCSWNVC